VPGRDKRLNETSPGARLEISKKAEDTGSEEERPLLFCARRLYIFPHTPQVIWERSRKRK
jgi:hypothetical protein